MKKRRKRRAQRQGARRAKPEGRDPANQEGSEVLTPNAAERDKPRKASESRAKSLPVRPHFLMILFSVIGIVLSCAGLYWAIAQPDLRYVASLSPETMTVVESKIDSEGNFVHSLRVRPTFTNYSFKPGFIDKAEWVPQSIATIPDIKITSISKSNIYWHQKKQIEITFLMTVPTDSIHNLNTTRELKMEHVLAVYDNTGRKVEHLENGLFGRIRFNFADTVTTQLGGTQ